MPITAVSYGDKVLTLDEAEAAYRDGSLRWPVPFAYFKAAVAQNRPRNFVSPSQLAHCPRQFVLKQTEDYTVDLSNESSTMKGTALHTLFEDQLRDEEGFIQEQRLSRSIELEVDGEPFTLTLSGQPDLVTPYNVIEDYKTTGTYIKKDFNGYDGHKLQLSIYGWIVRGATDRPVHWGRLWYLGNRQEKLIEFELYDDATVEAWIAHYAPEYVRWLRDNSYIPPIPEDEEMLKFCKYCPLQNVCSALEERGM